MRDLVFEFLAKIERVRRFDWDVRLSARKIDN